MQNKGLICKARDGTLKLTCVNYRSNRHYLLDKYAAAASYFPSCLLSQVAQPELG